MLAGARGPGGRRRDRCATMRRAHDRQPPSPAAPAIDPPAIRADLRNVAIVAHVDHGKTTLVDAMLRQTGAFRANQAVVDRVMDSGDLEREKGITILAKQTTVDYAGIRLNIVDTPGHADFGGEVERSLLMVDSVLLLVDAAEGPLPQTRYVLQKAMARHLPVVVAHQQDRPRRRPAGRGRSTTSTSCSWTSAPTSTRSSSRSSTRTPRPARRPATSPSPGTDLRPLLDLLVEVTPPPTYTPGHPLQLLVTNLSANDYVGRMAVGRIWNGTIRTGPADHGRARGGRRHGRDRRARPDGHADRHRHEPADRPRHRARRHRARPARATSSASPGCPRSRSATRSPTRPTRGRCRASTSTRRRCA